ncbi:sortase domain-containing protein [Nocardioides panzhihuensis]|uniref:Sortase A n=1 Tax=Nocardioides panzhihuensis TaxID=860243 RepID=A0A7Z0DKB5_9ACTN|nr:sortase [Nocardioides panzhihuensis]NYI76982.1 sortase A [Nocardioides panzhihuensis]
MNTTSPWSVAAALTALGALVLAGCSTPEGDIDAPVSVTTSPAGPPPSPSTSSTAPPPSPTETPLSSDGRPMRGELFIPRIGVTDLVVVPYRGWTDDAHGTEIQNGGVAASPHGPRGGTGPGGIGNYQVTAHRLSSTRAFLRLPELERGDRVRVRTEEATYVYRITGTRETSFRSAASLRAQRAAVPGKPGQEPTRAMITLSTCATPEDHAAGNYWSDEFDNPEHRIDKIGVLVAVR